MVPKKSEKRTRKKMNLQTFKKLKVTFSSSEEERKSENKLCKFKIE